MKLPDGILTENVWQLMRRFVLPFESWGWYIYGCSMGVGCHITLVKRVFLNYMGWIIYPISQAELQTKIADDFQTKMYGNKALYYHGYAGAGDGDLAVHVKNIRLRECSNPPCLYQLQGFLQYESTINQWFTNAASLHESWDARCNTQFYCILCYGILRTVSGL